MIVARILMGCLIVGLLSGCKWAEPDKIGLKEGKLHGCPDSPNCVSTSASGSHFIEPIRVKKNLSTEEVMDIVKKIVAGMPRTEIRREKGDYLWVIFKTRMGFVDDVEFLYDTDKKELFFRSASRVGYYDFDVNRNRFNAIRKIMKRDYPNTFDVGTL